VVGARLLNVVLAALCVPLTYRIGKELWGQRIGFAAAGLLAVDPFHVFWPQLLLSENLQVLLVTLLGVLLVTPKQTILRAQLIGLVSALAVLTHPGTVPIVAAGLFWYWLHWRKTSLAWRNLAFLAVTFLILMSSWTVRNWLLVGAFVPLTTGIESSAGGFVFWISNNHLTAQPGEYWGRFIPAKEYPNMPDFAAYDSQTSSSVTQLDRKGYEYGLKFLSTHPQQVPVLLLGKLVRFWEPKLITRSGELTVPLLGLVVVPLYLVGLVVHWRNSTKSRLVVAFVGGALLLALVYWGDSRFRTPVEAYFVLAFAAGLLQFADWARSAMHRGKVTDRTNHWRSSGNG
jgi:4-amino-4-deoxy-L-arabinose transferase-like glycosyltransferase